MEGVEDPEAAAALAGHRLLMRADNRPELDGEDEFYVQQLIGMQVLRNYLVLCAATHRHAGTQKLPTVSFSLGSAGQIGECDGRV